MVRKSLTCKGYNTRMSNNQEVGARSLQESKTKGIPRKLNFGWVPCVSELLYSLASPLAAGLSLKGINLPGTSWTLL